MRTQTQFLNVMTSKMREMLSMHFRMPLQMSLQISFAAVIRKCNN